MKANPKLSIILRNDKVRKDDTCPIYYSVRYRNKSKKFSTEYSAKKTEWNDKKGLPKDIRVANILERKKNEFEKWVIEMNISNKPFSFELIQDFFSGNSLEDFLEYYDNEIKRNIKSLKPNTIKGYRSNLNVLREFMDRITFGDIDIKFIEEFEHYLRNEREITAGGRYGHHKNLKATLCRALREKRIKENPYVEHKFEIPKPLAREIFLDERDIAVIKKLKIPTKNHGLIRTKEIFLFCCYTGLRYGDVISLEWKHLHRIGNHEFIVKEQNKTARKVSIPLPKEALEILNDRKGINPTRVFDDVSNQKLNFNLKKICAVAKIKKYTTFHIARHSFASVAVAKNKNLYVLSKIMGHSSIKQTEKYAKLNQSSLIDFLD